GHLLRARVRAARRGGDRRRARGRRLDVRALHARGVARTARPEAPPARPRGAALLRPPPPGLVPAGPRQRARAGDRARAGPRRRRLGRARRARGRRRAPPRPTPLTPPAAACYRRRGMAVAARGRRRRRRGPATAGPHLETLLWRVGIRHVAGVDEVGMGPL